MLGFMLLSLLATADAEIEMAKLQGIWKVVERCGSHWMVVGMEPTYWSINSHVICFHRNLPDTEGNTWTKRIYGFHIYPAKDATRFELTTSNGQSQEITGGIYRCEGECLRVCLNKKGKQEPPSSLGIGPERTLVILKRQEWASWPRSLPTEGK